MTLQLLEEAPQIKPKLRLLTEEQPDNILDILTQATRATEGLIPGQTPLRITNNLMRNWNTIQGIPIDKTAKIPPERKNFFFVAPGQENEVIRRQWRNYFKKPEKYKLTSESTIEDAVKVFDQQNPQNKLKFLKDKGIDIKKKLKDFKVSLMNFIDPSAEAAILTPEVTNFPEEIKDNPIAKLIQEEKPYIPTLTDLKSTLSALMKGAGMVTKKTPFAVPFAPREIPTSEETTALLKTISFPLRQITRPFEAIRAGAGAAIEGQPPLRLLQETAKGFIRPQEVRTLTSKIPFQEVEQGNWARLIPRALLEGLETFALYNVGTGGKIIKQLSKESQYQQGLQKIENALPLIEKAGISWPKGITNPEKVQAIISYARVNPQAGEALKRILSVPSEMYAGIPIPRPKPFAPRLPLKVPKPSLVAPIAGQVSKAILPELQPLAEEAKKYKSAEEFVKTFKQSKQMGVTDFKEVNTQLPIGEGKIYEQILSMPEYRDERVVEIAGKEIKKPITIFADNPFDLANSQIEIIDGWHRLRQAISNKDKSIPVKVLTSDTQLTDFYNQVKGIAPTEKNIPFELEEEQEVTIPFKTKKVKSEMEKYLEEYDKGEPGSLYSIIKSEGGIAPYKKGLAGALTEEYRENVPVFLRNKEGLPLDEMADALKTRYPHLNIETESDLLEALVNKRIAPDIEYIDKGLEEETQVAPVLTYKGPLFKAIFKADAEWRVSTGGKMTTPKALDKIKKTLGEGRYRVIGGKEPNEIMIEEIEPITPLSKPQEIIRKKAINKLPEELRSERLKTITNQLIKLSEIAPRLITPKQIAYIHILKQKNLLTDQQYTRLRKIFTGKKTLKVTTPTGKLKLAPATQEEALRLIGALKTIIPRKPLITGQPPVIPRTKALVPSEWNQPFNDLTTFQAAPLSGLDPIRAAELVDGKTDGVVSRYIVEPARRAERAWKNELKSTLDAITKISEKMSSKSKASELTFRYTEKTLEPEEEILVTQNMKNTAIYMSKVYDNLLERINNVRRMLGKVEIRKRADYITHTWELSLLDEFYQGLSNVPDDAINIPPFAKSNSPFFKFSLARLGGKEFRVDAIAAFRTYISRALPVIYNTEVLKSARPLVERLPPNAYKYFTQYLDETMALRPTQADKLVPRPILTGITWLRLKMGKGAILGNVASVFNQAFTLPNTISAIGPKWVASAALKMHRDEWRAFTEAHSKVLQGRIYEIDFDPTILSRVDNALGFFLQLGDKEMVRLAWGAQFEKSLSKGASFEQAVREADNIAFKTQSSFNVTDLPPAFRSKIASSFLQFQNTVNNGLNYLRFDLGKEGNERGKWGVFKSALIWLTTLLILNRVYKEFGIPSAVDEWTDVFPLISMAEYGPPVTYSIPTAILGLILAKTPQDRTKAARSLRRSIFLFLPAGSQVRKSLEGIYSVSQGGKFDKKGRLQFPIRGLPEQVRAVTFGPYGTKTGKAYIRRGFKKEKTLTLRLLR